MRKTLVGWAFALALVSLAPRGLAQVAAVIQLSAEEAAKASQVVEGMKSARDRWERTTSAWRDFHRRYQGAHPDVPGLRFSEDFRIAFGAESGPLTAEAVVVELSAEDRQRAETLYREMLEGGQALELVRKNWEIYQHELLLVHVPGTASGFSISLPDGRSTVIPALWQSGIAFSPDFRIAIPKGR